MSKKRNSTYPLTRKSQKTHFSTFIAETTCKTSKNCQTLNYIRHMRLQILTFNILRVNLKNRQQTPINLGL